LSVAVAMTLGCHVLRTPPVLPGPGLKLAVTRDKETAR